MEKSDFYNVAGEWDSEFEGEPGDCPKNLKWGLKELLSRKQLVANMDIDGLISSIHVQKVSPKFKVSGFTDSINQVYVPKAASGYSDMAFLDIYTKHGFCVDNHMINIPGMEFAQVLNMNQLRRRDMSGYSRKFPFGTCFIIMSLFDRTGIYDDIDPDLLIGQHNGFPVRLWHLYVRADDALTTTAHKFTENAIEWWNFMLRISGRNGLMNKIYERLFPFVVSCTDSSSGREWKISESERIKDCVNNFLEHSFMTDTPKHDGYKKLNPDCYAMYETMCDWFGVEPNIINPDELELLGYARLILDLKNTSADSNAIFGEILSDPRVISHAFTQYKVLAFDVRLADVQDFRNSYDIKRVDYPIDRPFYDIPYTK